MVSRIQSPKLKRVEDSTTEKSEKNIKYLPIKIKSKKHISEGLKYTGYYFVLQSNKMYLHGGSMMIFCNFPKKNTATTSHKIFCDFVTFCQFSLTISETELDYHY